MLEWTPDKPGLLEAVSIGWLGCIVTGRPGSAGLIIYGQALVEAASCHREKSAGKENWGRPVSGATQTLAGIRVMVIDDSNTIRRSAESFLAKAGCEVILAEDGFDALSKIADYLPDVIFIDIMMPRLDGYQTCALIKKNPKFRVTPVVMLSSKDGLFDRARGRIAGSDEYLAKPFTRESLLEAVGRHMARRSISQESERKNDYQ